MKGVLSLLVIACLTVSFVDAIDVGRRLRRPHPPPAKPELKKGEACAYGSNRGLCESTSACTKKGFKGVSGPSYRCALNLVCCYEPKPRNSGGNGGSTTPANGGTSNNGGSGTTPVKPPATNGGNTNTGGGSTAPTTYDPTNVDSVRVGKKIVPVNGDRDCTRTYDLARLQHRTHWEMCISYTDTSSVPCVWSIEDSACVGRRDTNNIPILTNALKYESDFVKKFYEKHPVTYVDLADPDSVQTYQPIARAASPALIACVQANTWQLCILTADQAVLKEHCLWSIEDATCVGRTDKVNAAIVAHALAYPVTFVAAHYKVPDFPKFVRPSADESKPDSVKHAAKSIDVVNGDGDCSRTREIARAQHRNHWDQCVAYTDKSSIPCRWSLEDAACVSRNDITNAAITANALRYTTAFVQAHYAKNPVTYVDLADPASVQTYAPIALSGQSGKCSLNTDPVICTIDRDELTPGKPCVWSIEDARCVSRSDTVNAAIVAHAMAYGPDFVKKHYGK